MNKTPLFEEISDTSGLVLLNPDLKNRQNAKIKLSNGLEALLVSDPQADQSSASLSVEAGSWDDPEEYPGMAHFCEHMLFMGTKKYPDVNSFMNRVSDFGGMTNAYTAPHRTVYMFSCKHEGFSENLDRFAHFFIDPLFNPENISRELHAVDQEYAKNLENDAWREYMVFKETGNKNHPNHKFSAGNSQTLKNIPREALVTWQNQNYAASRMHLFVYSPLPLDELKQFVASTFETVPDHKISHKDLPKSITSEQQKGNIIWIEPVQKKQTLSLAWELPSDLVNEGSKSAGLVAYALNRGASHSLYELLKTEELIDSLSVQVDDLGGKNHQFFSFNIDLTAKGLENIDIVSLRCFEAIALLKQTGVPQYLFEEKNNVAKITYEYQTRADAFQMAESMGGSLPDEPLHSYPREKIIADLYNPEKIARTLQVLEPSACMLTVAAQSELTKRVSDTKEKWFHVPYSIQKTPKDWLVAWEASNINPNIHLAEKNPFIPTNFELFKGDSSQGPTLISESEKAIAYFARAQQFSAPEAVVHLHIKSPLLQDTAKSSCLCFLYLDHLTDALHPTLSAAKSAGLNARFDLEKLKLHIKISGFNDKTLLLLQTIVEEMPKNKPTRSQFEIYVDRHQQLYDNGATALPVMQAKDLLESLLMTDRTTLAEKGEALPRITYEDFLQFHENLLSEVYIETLFSGNLLAEDATKAAKNIESMLGKKAYLKKDHVEPKVLKLSKDAGPFSVTKSTKAQGNAAILTVDLGNFSFSARAAQEVLGTALREAFFNELRTKQKTGYIAKAEPTEIEERLFQLFLVQSNSHAPEDLLYRFELFLEEFVESIATSIPEERFSNLKHSCTHSLKTRFRNLNDISSLWNILAFEKGADFAFIEKRIEALENLSYEDFLSFSKEVLSRKNLKRLAVLYKGQIPSPFTYQGVDSASFVEHSKYVTKREL